MGRRIHPSLAVRSYICLSKSHPTCKEGESRPWAAKTLLFQLQKCRCFLCSELCFLQAQGPCKSECQSAPPSLRSGHGRTWRSVQSPQPWSLVVHQPCRTICCLKSYFGLVLPGFKSRCTMFYICKYSTARKICLMIPDDSSSGNCCCRSLYSSISFDSTPPLISSIPRNILPLISRIYKS